MKRRGLTIFATGLAAVSLAACGEEEQQPAQPERPQAQQPERQQPAAQARTLRQETQALLRDLTETTRALVGETPAREQELEELQAEERRARELAERARTRLPEGDLDRRALVALNESVARVASRIRRLTESEDVAARGQARAELELAEEAVRRLPRLDERTRAELARQLADLSELVVRIRAR